MLKILKTLTLTILLFAATTSSAFALSLSEAKSQGAVGEEANGYLGAVSAPSAEVQALINDVNNKRRARYQVISNKNGKPLATVEQRAATKAAQRTKAGNYIKKGGQWVKK